MKITISREKLLEPLQNISGVVEKRQTLPILANILINAENGKISFTATDLEVELQTQVEVDFSGLSEFTIPARKLLDICKALPDDAKITLHSVYCRLRTIRL